MERLAAYQEGATTDRISDEELLKLARERLLTFPYMREYCAAYYDTAPGPLSQEMIRQYALTRHKFDAVDVSRIVPALKSRYHKEKNDEDD
jgi:hypothetical protein